MLAKEKKEELLLGRVNKMTSFIKAKDIIGNKVVSQSGYQLGKVADFELDIFGQRVIKYYTHGGLLDFLKEPLAISADQVIEITKEKIVVADGVIPQGVIKKKPAPNIGYAK